MKWLRDLFFDPSDCERWGLSQTDLETLSIYNSERGRGLVHTEEWKVRMRELQDKFNRALKNEKESA